MRNKNIFVIIVGILIVSGMGYYFYQSYQKPKNDTSNVSAVSKFQETKTDFQNGVEITVKIKPCDDFCENSTFEVSFTTHENDLSFDLVKVSTLEVDGKVYEAKSWDGGSGGHHLSGTLTFPGIAQEPSKMVLKLENIAGVNRTFTWE